MNTLDDISAFTKETFELKALRAVEAEKVVRATCKNGNVSMVYGISALHAAWQTFFGLPPTDRLGSHTSSLTNLFVANHLSWLCNTAVAIRSLAFQGLEPQARVLTRSFVEAIYQTLVLFHDEATYTAYLKATSNDGAKEAYYKLFSKKQGLQKKLQILEDELDHSPATDRALQLKQRVDVLQLYSQATHASSLHILTSALQPDEDSNLCPTILGRVTTATENTLLNCSHEICYFSILFDYIVRNVWKVPKISDNAHYDMFFKTASLAAKCRSHKVKGEPGVSSP
jgi:hypothetical protein